jgi:hypothetical protein
MGMEEIAGCVNLTLVYASVSPELNWRRWTWKIDLEDMEARVHIFRYRSTIKKLPKVVQSQARTFYFNVDQMLFMQKEESLTELTRAQPHILRVPYRLGLHPYIKESFPTTSVS